MRDAHYGAWARVSPSYTAGEGKPRDTAPRWGMSVLAGAGAGAVAGLACIGAEMILHAQGPPYVPTFGSAFVAGLLGGVLYGWLARVARRPMAALWSITLVIATIDSALIAFLPAPSGPNPLSGVPINGLVAPLRQLLALAGAGHLGTRHYGGLFLIVVTLTHYITAAAVSLLVPWWSKMMPAASGIPRQRAA